MMMLMKALLVLAAAETAWAATSSFINEGDATSSVLGTQVTNLRLAGLTQGATAADPDGNSLSVAGGNTDATGTSVRMNQIYQGLRVFYNQVIDHSNADGSKTVSGRYTEGINADLGTVDASSYDPASALASMKQRCLSTQYAGQSMADLEFANEKAETVVYTGEGDSGTAVVCYFVNFFVVSTAQCSECTQPSHRMHYMVRADDGAVLQEWDGLTHAERGTGPGGNTEIGKYEFGTTSPYGKLDVAVSGGSCTMETPRVKTVNLNGGTSSSTTAFSYSCSAGSDYRHASDAINDAYSPLNDAHYYGEVVYKMFNDWYGAPPLSFQLVQRVHYGRRYENAFWDGSAMTYGDGHTFFFPLTTLDTVCHEVSHGVTEQNSNLVYRGQSGGINEAFSDMAGKACEHYLLGDVKNWQSGQDDTKSDKPLRYFDTPTADGNSIDHADNYKNGMDVHYSSGVYNHAFYNMGTASGWNAKKAFDCFVCANKNHWTASMNYEQAAVGVLACAKSLGYEEAVVVAAFADVGVCLPGANTGTCSGGGGGGGGGGTTGGGGGGGGTTAGGGGGSTGGGSTTASTDGSTASTGGSTGDYGSSTVGYGSTEGSTGSTGTVGYGSTEGSTGSTGTVGYGSTQETESTASTGYWGWK